MAQDLDRTNRRPMRRIAVGAIVLLVTLGLSACAGGSEGGGGSSSTSGPDSPATAAHTNPRSSTGAWVVAYSPEEYGPRDLTIAVSTDGKSWSDVGSSPLFMAMTEGPDGWIGLTFDGQVSTSSDLRTWTKGTTVASGVSFRAITYGGGRFVAVGSTTPGDGPAQPRAFWSEDGRSWTQGTIPALDIPNPTSAATDDVDLPTVVFDEGEGFVAHAVLAAAEGTGGQAVTVVSKDGSAWRVAGKAMAGNGATAAGGGRIVTGFVTNRLTADKRLRIGGVGSQSGPASAFETATGSPFEQRPISAVAYGNGKFLALAAESFNEGTGSGEHHAYTSADGRSWNEVGTFDGYISAMAFGDVGAAASASTTTSTTAGGTNADLRGVDWRNRSYEVCDQKPTLVDGRWENAADAVSIELLDPQYGDADGDGQEDVLLTFRCAPIGGNAYPTTANLVFTGSGGVHQLGNAFHGAQPTIVQGGVRTVDPVWNADDPRCCPSGSQVSVWHYKGGAWVATKSGTTPATPAPTTSPPITRPPGATPGALGSLPANHGYGPVGAGCSPGPGPLPDGWWFGYATNTPRPGGSFDFDLACFTWEKMSDTEHGHDDAVVTNENKTLRSVPVASGAPFTCSTVGLPDNSGDAPCNGYTDPAVWIRMQGGVATKVVTQLWWE